MPLNLAEDLLAFLMRSVDPIDDMNSETADALMRLVHVAEGATNATPQEKEVWGRMISDLAGLRIPIENIPSYLGAAIEFFRINAHDINFRRKRQSKIRSKPNKEKLADELDDLIDDVLTKHLDWSAGRLWNLMVITIGPARSEVGLNVENDGEAICLYSGEHKPKRVLKRSFRST